MGKNGQCQRGNNADLKIKKKTVEKGEELSVRHLPTSKPGMFNSSRKITV